MKQEWYELANEIDSSAEADTEEETRIDASITRNYKQDAFAAIRRKKHREKGRRAVAAAACLAVMAAATAVFHKEAQAAIEQIRYSISAALGKDMSRYREAVHRSVSDAGYRITLEDAIVAEEELLISYTVQRENGEKIGQYCSITGKLSVNGKQAAVSAGSSGGCLDPEQKIYGCQVSYRIPDVDLSGKNKYELEFEDREHKAKGNWKIQFEAYGSELFAETKTIQIGVSYQLPDGNQLTLDELALNELAHRVTFYTQKQGLKNEIELRAADDMGTTIRFPMAEFVNGKGVFENGYLIEDGEPKRNWVAKDAKKLTITVYISELSETGGESGWKQAGDAVELDL
ncbi:MAG: DUF4179 domain-containing protein [Eubacterium sp.]|nr:DUF4179 domain-containing protein [Eubacterium sp.]